jgi:hypothetical protein
MDGSLTLKSIDTRTVFAAVVTSDRSESRPVRRLADDPYRRLHTRGHRRHNLIAVRSETAAHQKQMVPNLSNTGRYAEPTTTRRRPKPTHRSL